MKKGKNLVLETSLVQVYSRQEDILIVPTSLGQRAGRNLPQFVPRIIARSLSFRPIAQYEDKVHSKCIWTAIDLPPGEHFVFTPELTGDVGFCVLDFGNAR